MSRANDNFLWVIASGLDKKLDDDQPTTSLAILYPSHRGLDKMDNKAASGSTHITPAAFDSFNTKLQTLALNATRNVLTLPGDIAFHRSIDSAFAKDIDVFSQRVLDLTNKLLNLVDTADLAKSKGKGKAKLESQDDVVDSFHSLVVDSMDQLLERTVSHLGF